MSKASHRAYDLIKARILDGSLQPGSQLKEDELAELCGVSRTPIRDAMHRLEAEMFIKRSDSQRSFVSSWSPEAIEELFTLRTMLEGHAAARAAERVTADTLELMHRNLEESHRAVDKPEPDIEAFLLMNAQFHWQIVESAASDQLSQMIKRLVLQPVVHRTALRYSADQLSRSVAEHGQIVLALAQHDADWAKSVMIAHIRRAFHVYRDDLGRVAG
jgi:DNA-binding GntR family transcriptional regulator